MKLRAVTHESWPIAGSFTISRGSKTSADVVVVTLEEDGLTGRGECVPYARYGETVQGCISAIEEAAPLIADGLTRSTLPSAIGPKAACNALDCAMWDLEAKRRAVPAWRLAGLDEMRPRETAFTISLAEADVMAEQAAAAEGRDLLKLKLGRADDAARLRTIRKAVPAKRLIVDANEGWNEANLEEMLEACAEAGVEMVEQPLPADGDDFLARIMRPVPVCADESVHGVASLDALTGKYDAINIKLDKTGGLTPALELAYEGKARGFQLMVGCMVATSLAMAPAFLVGQQARYVDLDGPLLLQKDRLPAIRYDGAIMFPPEAALWG